MSHSTLSSALGRAFHRQPPGVLIRHHLDSRSRRSHKQLRRAWIPRRRGGIMRYVLSVTNSPQKENRTYPKHILGLLHGLGFATDIREARPGKTDLSHADPLAPVWQRKQQQHGKVIGYHWAGLSKKGVAELFFYYYYYAVKKKPSGLPRAWELDGVATERVFTQEVLAYLEKHGCRPEDVMAWAWILTAKDGVLAVLRLDTWAKVEALRMEEETKQQEKLLKTRQLTLEWKTRVEHWKKLEKYSGLWSWNRAFGLFKKSPPKTSESIITLSHSLSHRIPPFLLLLLLRYPRLPPKTIRLLIPYIAAALRLAFDTKTHLVLLIRLLRHTRVTYHTAIPTVAQLLTTHVHPLTHPPKRSARLTATYNRLLTLFSYASHNRPFRSLLFHQRSQFLLLRKMAALDIPITREGYRALATVQLAHRKTQSETERVRAMGPMWPPWPQQRDGMGVPEAELSRAAQVLEQMCAAGYGRQKWEQGAMVLAGMDTDGSPTVQTRTWYGKIGIAAARVRATRTVEEAWMVFCECEEKGMDVWEEMFEKLVAARKVGLLVEKRKRRLESIKVSFERSGGQPSPALVKELRRWDVEAIAVAEREKRVVAGDAKEVVVGLRGKGVYVGSPVPRVQELFKMMKRVEKLKSSERLLCMLVKNAESVEDGEWILMTWSRERWRRMVKGSAHPSEVPNTPRPGAQTYRERHYRNAPPKVLTSYLHLLFAHSHNTSAPPSTDYTDFALRLLLGHKPAYPPAWNTVMNGLVASLYSPRVHRDLKHRNVEMIWQLYKNMAQRVELDVETLRILCVAAERALKLVEQVYRENGAELKILWDDCEPVEKVVEVFERVLELRKEAEEQNQEKAEKEETARKKLQEEPLPLIVMPEPAALHAYIRILGFTGRRDHILQLLKWMRHNSADIDMETPMARRVLVAARVFLGDDVAVAAEAREVVEEWLSGNDIDREERTGWPGEDEVEEYCILGGMY